MAADMSGGSRIAGRGIARDWTEEECEWEEEALGVYREGRMEGK